MVMIHGKRKYGYEYLHIYVYVLTHTHIYIYLFKILIYIYPMKNGNNHDNIQSSCQGSSQGICCSRLQRPSPAAWHSAQGTTTMRCRIPAKPLRRRPKTTKNHEKKWWWLGCCMVFIQFLCFFYDFYGFYLVSMVCDGFVLCFLNGLIWLHGVLGWFPHQGLADDEMRLSWQECGFDCQRAGKDGLHRWWFACFYLEV